MIQLKGSIMFEKEMPILINNVMWAIIAVVIFMLAITFLNTKYLYLVKYVNATLMLRQIFEELNLDHRENDMAQEDWALLRV